MIEIGLLIYCMIGAGVAGGSNCKGVLQTLIALFCWPMAIGFILGKVAEIPFPEHKRNVP
jgi:hypothetical protein